VNALAPLIHFPVAVWTVLVAISMVYWLFVMSGLVHMGEGAPDVGDVGGADVDADVDVGGHGGAEGHGADGHDGAADGHDVGGDDAPAGIAGFFRFKHVPITVSVSLVSFFAWVITLAAFFGMARAGFHPGLAVECVVAFVGAPMFAFPIARLATRPLAPLLTPRRAKSSHDLIGQSCVIRTGSADERFGEAVVKDTGPDLVLRVRVEGTTMKRGEEGVIVGFDEAREEYLVAPIEDRHRS